MLINIFEARNKLSGLIKRVQAGETVVIGNRGLPVAKLIPANDDLVGKGDAATILDWLDSNPLPAHLQQSDDEIQSRIKAERNSWG